MSYETIEYEVEDGAGVIRLDRPDKLNPISTQMREELVDALHNAEGDNEIRAAVITGNGRAFSAGYDFGEEDEGEVGLEEYMLDFDHDYLNEILKLDIPVIAAVNGLAFAGAQNLCLYCDITISSDEAEFGYPEMHMGSMPGRLIDPYVGVSVKHVKELYFSGKRIDAREAERIGIVNRTVPHDDLMDEVREIVEGIKLAPPSVVALSKAMLNEAMEKQGFRMDGRLDDLLWTISMEVEAGKKFREIVEEEGVNAGIEWMHSTEKTR